MKRWTWARLSLGICSVLLLFLCVNLPAVAIDPTITPTTPGPTGAPITPTTPTTPSTQTPPGSTAGQTAPTTPTTPAGQTAPTTPTTPAAPAAPTTPAAPAAPTTPAAPAAPTTPAAPAAPAPDCSTLGHDYQTSVTAQATCMGQGVETATCIRCGSSYNVAIYPLGHSYQTLVKTPPTCTTEGVEETKCTRCGEGWTKPLPALGHALTTAVTKEATCTSGGVETTTCARCDYTEETPVAAPGHDLHTSITKEATCTEEGVKTTRCSRCDYRTTETVAALGHDYEVTSSQASCTEGVDTHSVCSRCGDEKTESAAASGHDYGEYVVVREATCEEDGLRRATCSRCGDVSEEVIPQTGHSFPEDWIVETEAGMLSPGVESRTCTVCDAREEHPIPQKSTMPLAAGGVALAAAATGGIFLKRKRSVIPAAAGSMVGAAKAADALGKLPLETKKVVICSEDPKLLALLKSKRFVKDTHCRWSDLAETAKKEEADLVVCSVDSQKRLDEVVALKNGDLKGIATGLVVDQAIYEQEKVRLEELKKAQTISNYISSAYDAHAVMVRLIAPHLKPEAKSDTVLESIGMVADAMGIPGLSTVIETFTSGRELKDTLKNTDLGAMDLATIISDIANILGFESAANVIELVTEIDQVKENTRKEKGETESGSNE